MPGVGAGPGGDPGLPARSGPRQPAAPGSSHNRPRPRSADGRRGGSAHTLGRASEGPRAQGQTGRSGLPTARSSGRSEYTGRGCPPTPMEEGPWGGQGSVWSLVFHV